MIALLIVGRCAPDRSREAALAHMRDVQDPMVYAPPLDAGPTPRAYGQKSKFRAPWRAIFPCNTEGRAPMTLHAIRRVVTGHDPEGRSAIAHDGPPPTVVELPAIPGTWFHEIWSTRGSPTPVGDGADPTLAPLSLPPPSQGTRIRFVDIPPDTPEFLARGAQRMQDAFREIGDAAASTAKADSPHPLMHRTQPIDYGIIVDGEITLVLDTAQTPLRRGDVVIQRGTNHAWANLSGKPCRMIFVLVDGRFDPDIPGGEAP
jgi:hypothetical protein